MQLYYSWSPVNFNRPAGYRTVAEQVVLIRGLHAKNGSLITSRDLRKFHISRLPIKHKRYEKPQSYQTYHEQRQREVYKPQAWKGGGEGDDRRKGGRGGGEEERGREGVGEERSLECIENEGEVVIQTQEWSGDSLKERSYCEARLKTSNLQKLALTLPNHTVWSR